MIIQVLVILLLIILISVTVLIYNILVNLRNNVNRSRSGIDVYLQKRFDLIPNLIEVTKTYMNYERELLEKISNLRSSFAQNKNMEAIKELNHQYNIIMASIENYPELKASEQFMNLQKSLIKVENELQAVRRIYNNDVTKYNTKISMFPNSIIAKILGFKPYDLFELEGEKDIIVKF